MMGSTIQSFLAFAFRPSAAMVSHSFGRYSKAWIVFVVLGAVTNVRAQNTYYLDLAPLSAGPGTNSDFLWSTTIANFWSTDPAGNSATVNWPNLTPANNAFLGMGTGTGSYNAILFENISVGVISINSGSWTIALNSRTLTLDSATDSNPGVAITGAGSLIKNGASTVTISSVNNFTGGTTIGGGTLAFTNTNTSVGPVEVNSGGTLQLGGSTAVPATTVLTLTGGTLSLSGAYNPSFSSLTLGSGSSTIDFGSGFGASTISFGTSIAQTWVGSLTISNYTSGSDALRFGSDSTGLSLGQLAVINFTGFDNGAMIDDSGFVTPVPEPSTYAAMIGGLALAFGAYRRRTAKAVSESLNSNR